MTIGSHDQKPTLNNSKPEHGKTHKTTQSVSDDETWMLASEMFSVSI